MNRTILFRGKREDNGEWVEGWYSLDENGKTNIILSDGMYAGYWAEVDPDTVGQYTGLKDKNGVKIFEGDVVENPIKFKSIIEYYNGLFLPFTESEITLFRVDECQVIGNIHDNPELLGGDNT